MIDALRGINRFDYSSEGAFLKYLNRVVANKIRDEADKQNAQMRNAAREVSLEDGRSAQSGVPLISRLRDSGVPSPSQLLVLREDLALLERAMDLLPEKYGTRGEDYRDLIVAVELEQRSYRELSEEYGKSPDAIRVQFTRAKAALTRVFQELSDDE
jgi:RNA polymerase sigma factor (sigma-70 family)